MNIRQAWLRMTMDTGYEIGYDGFRYNLLKLANEKKVTDVSEEFYKTVVNFYRYKQECGAVQIRKGGNKLQLMKKILEVMKEQEDTIVGSRLVYLCEINNAYSRSSIYRYCKQQLNEPFKAKEVYNVEQVKRILKIGRFQKAA